MSADRAALLALAARVEAAAAGSRELDGTIWCALDGRGWTFRDVAPPWNMSVTRPDYAYPWFVPMPPAYTRDLTAALALVPEGWRIFMERLPLTSGPMWQAMVRPHGADGHETDWCYTPALALTAAALRARAAAAVDD